MSIDPMELDPGLDSDLDLPTRINIACDKLATETSQATMADGTPPVLPPTL